MDEKRAIIAVVLIFVVLFGFNYWQSMQRRDAAVEQAAQGQPAESPVATEEPSDGGAEDESGTREGAVEDASPTDEEVAAAPRDTLDIPEKTVTVETRLWTATLSNRGGAITSWRMKEYDDHEGRPVSLVSEGGKALSLGIEYGAAVLPVDDLAFDYSGADFIRLDEGSAPAVLTYTAVGDDGLAITRSYTFYGDSYAFRAAVSVSGLRDPAARRNLWVGWPGVARTEAKEDSKAAASVVRIDGGIARDGLGRFKDSPEYARVGEVEWVTSQSRYFMAAVAPEGVAFQETRALGDRETGLVGFRSAVPMEGESFDVAFAVFAGPQDYKLISGMGVGLERAIDMGWSFTRPLSVLMLRALVWAYRYVPNYGVVIILFSILTKLLFYRLTHKSFTEMKRMQDVQPKLNALKEKHADDKEGLAKAQMELYKKEGVNPLGSCLPMILQMPVFIALFQVLRTTIELRGAPFMLWITDLSQPDTIAAIAGFPIHILPLLMGLGMLLQQRFTTTDPSQAGIGKMMPILFTVLFYNFASGLVIYWLVNTVLSIGQQYYIHRGPSASAEVSSVGVAPDGVHTSAPAPGGAPAPEIEEAEVVGEDNTDRSKASSTKKRRKNRRRKKK
jgi:YidC/Oxa1 family membrane protein insertase